MSTFRKIYTAYGGYPAFFKSPYLWLGITSTLICICGIIPNDSWVELPIKVIPPLAGFTFASFSLLFAIIDDDNRLILSQPDPELNNRKPILVIVSKIVHSVFIQLAALSAALLVQTKPLIIPVDIYYLDIANNIATGIALFLFIYGLLLVFSVAKTLFELIEIVADASDLSSYEE